VQPAGLSSTTRPTVLIPQPQVLCMVEKSVPVNKVSTPWITPTTTDFSGSVTVVLNNYFGVVIHYTTDGSTPTEASQVYSGSFTLDASTTIRAIGVKNGEINSDILSKTYTRVYTIGETGPAGGKIFYVNPNHVNDKWTYLEMAPEDEKTIYAFGGYNILIGEKAQGTAIGTGKSNTEAIVKRYGAYDPNYGSGSKTYGAKICDAKSISHNGVVYDDWFLPSIDEVEEMFKNRDETLWQGHYLSSSEATSTNAWIKYFSSDYRAVKAQKSVFYGVRAIRSF